MTDPTRQVVEEVVASVLARRLARGPSGRRVALGSDHAGFQLKRILERFLQDELEWGVMDCGTNSEESVDYPDIALRVAQAVAVGEAPRGIMIDGAGVGSTMVCNRVPGILAAPGFDLFTVKNSREHNDANVLVLGSRNISAGEARRLVRVWLSTPFAGGRHARRVEKIRRMDQRPEHGSG
jgi:ribose 5-phosphate isomerase B